ncbi:Glyoxylate reductase [Burkholderiales bacterium]|nr:Glyoxylate reductase [Burkholderiales bacterium]
MAVTGADTGNRPRVVVTRRIFPDLAQQLRRDYEVLDNQDDANWTTEELLARLSAADALLTDPVRQIDAQVLARCPRLCVISNIAVGFNNIDVAACTRAGIVATNTPDVLTEATADHAWALLLAAARRVVEADRWTRAGRWERFAYDAFLGADVCGATLGILGMGRIGQAIARRAQGFSMRVIYHNRHALPAQAVPGAAPEQARWVERPQLLRDADFLVLLVPYSAATHHLIGTAELAQMKPGSVLINIARGGIVDDAALAQALRAGCPAAAGLDVMENEPHIHPALLALDNVVLTPHIGSATATARRAMVRLAIENLADVLQGRRPRALVNGEVWASRRCAAPAAG